MRDWLRKTLTKMIAWGMGSVVLLACGQLEATAQQYRPGSAPKVTNTRASYEEETSYGQRRDPAPQITQQRRTVQSPRNPVPSYARHPQDHPNTHRPPANRRPQAAPHVDHNVEPARYRSQHYRNRESEIFYDDASYTEELPGPGPSGDIMYEDSYMEGYDGYGEGPWHDGPYYDDPYGGCDSCGGSCGGQCGYGRPFCRLFDWLMGPSCDWCWSENLTAFGGMDGFTNAVDLDNKGNFGFDYGIDWAGPLWNKWGLGYQLGGRVVHSNLSGYDQMNTLGLFDDDGRHQYFLTAGVFRRFRHCTGLQWGVVYDYLRDDYYTEASLSQVRGEISFRGPKQIELGVWASANVGDDSVLNNFVNQVTATNFGTWETVDQYNLFVRFTSCTGNEMRIWGGVTGESDGIVGGDFRLPFNDRFAIVGIGNYIIPEEGANQIGAREENWGLGLNLVWYPGRSAQTASCSRWRPLFNVANNATMVPMLTDSAVSP